MKQKITHILKTSPWSINLHLGILTYQKTKLQTYQYYHPCSNANPTDGQTKIALVKQQNIPERKINNSISSWLSVKNLNVRKYE